MNDERLYTGGIRVELGKTIPIQRTAQGSVAVFSIPNETPERIKSLTDLALSHIALEDYPIVFAWRKKLFSPEGLPEICDELPRLLTEFLRKPENDALPPYTRRARALQHVFAHKTALVQATDLLPGQTTTSFVGPVVYMDMSGYCIWPELETIASRPQNPFKIRPEVAERLNKEVFPFWLQRRPVQEAARYSDYDTADYANDGRDSIESVPGIDPPLKKRAGQTPKCQELFERVAFYLSDKATAVSHTTPDFGRVLEYGFDGLVAQLQADLKQGVTTDARQKEFLEGVIAVYEGAKVYAMHLAEAAHNAKNFELEAICRKVPAQPADTLAEAVCTVWICYHLLLQENTNFGLSLGRLDQTLNPYYLRDWEKLASDSERDAYVKRSVELLCHLFLRCSDHVPLSPESAEVLFAGSGSNQALTVGGTRYENGQTVDAVNDMTYIILKATELLSIRDPNVHARYHKDVHHRNPDGSPMQPGEVDAYLKRICQVNLSTRATPALHGDVPVIQSMARYYKDHAGISEQEALTDAHDYASIGCIEQNADHKHYGHTGSTLLLLPAVLELAIYGGKHRSDGVGKDDSNLYYGTKEYTSTPLVKMGSMDEFIKAFEKQLDEMARHCVQFNNYLGRTLEKIRPSPFLSGLFDGPTNKPGMSGARLRDVSSGGAKYNSSGVAIIGLADVIDGFCAIDDLVFCSKMSAQEMLDAMAVNFDGGAPQQKHNLLDDIQHLLGIGKKADAQPHISPARLREIREAIRLTPKYGAGVEVVGTYNNALAVKYTNLLTDMIQKVFYKYRTHRGGRYLAGYWSMTNHAGFGMLSKATPNGRQARQPFAGGITPCPGIVKRNGDPVTLYDHMMSVAKVDADTVQNGYTYNLSLTPRGAGYFDEDSELFAHHMKAFMDANGVLVQLCVSSIDDLKAANDAATAASQPGAGAEAQAALAPYKDMMIRVAGYSAYFVTLSPQMRQEIIGRANFGMASSDEQPTAH